MEVLSLHNTRNCNELELSKSYDVLGFLLNGHDHTDCIRHAILLSLRVKFAYMCAAGKDGKYFELLNISENSTIMCLKLSELLI